MKIIYLSKRRIDRAYKKSSRLHSIADKNPEKLIEFLFKYPCLVEKFFANAIRSMECDSILSEYFHLLYDIYPPEVQPDMYPRKTNVGNIRNVIRLIKKNKWDIKKWDEQNIYTEDFKTICRIPIYVPFFYLQLLSGEYILHLLHPNDISLQYCPTKPIQNLGEATADYRARCAQKEYSRKHEIFFKSEKSTIRSYEEQFENCFHISFDALFPQKDTTTVHLKERKNTVAWQMFDAFAYCDRELNKELPERFDMFSAFSKGDELYLNYTESALIKNDMVLPQRYTNMLLFKTFLFQQLRHDSIRRELSIFSLKTEILIYQIEETSWRFRNHLAKIESERRLGEPRFDTYWKNLLLLTRTIASEIIDTKLGFTNPPSSPPIRLESSNLYRTIFWKLLVAESLAIMKTFKGSFNVKTRSYNEIEKIHQYICANPDQPIGVCSWKDFYGKYQTQLEEFFPDRSYSRLEADWWLTIKVCLYVVPSVLHLHNISIPKKVDAPWLQKQGIYIGNITSACIFSTMQVVIHASEWKVRKKDIKVMSEKKNSLVTAQLYRNLSSGSPERFNQSLRFILENVEKKSLRDPMILQLRTMIQEQLLGFHLTQEDFQLSRNLQEALWLHWEQTVLNVSCFEDYERQYTSFLRTLKDVEDSILQLRSRILNQ